MWGWVKISLLSLIIIFLVHHLYNMMLDNFTTPSVKDFVREPKSEYEKMMKTAMTSNKPEKNDTTSIDDIPVEMAESSDMKNQLKNFIKKEIHTTNNNNLSSSNLGYSNIAN